MNTNTSGHRGTPPPPPLKLPIGLGVVLVVVVVAVVLTPVAWWLGLIVWLVVAVGLLAVERMGVARANFDEMTRVSPAEPRPQQEAPEAKRRQA